MHTQPLRSARDRGYRPTTLIRPEDRGEDSLTMLLLLLLLQASITTPSGGQHPLRPRRGGTSIKGSWPGGPGGGAPGEKIADFFHGRRCRGTPRASERFMLAVMCQRCGACPRERLPCRPPGCLRAGAPLQPASWPHRLSSLLSKLFPFIRAAAVGRSRPAESSTSLFDWASRAPQALRK